MSEVSPVGVEWLHSRQKRRFDRLAAGVVLPMVLPAIVAGGSAYFLETGNKPLYLQRRRGANGESITVPKLRTLRTGDNLYDGSFGARDPRATRVGAFLRTHTIDEFPQVFSILRGDMSIVGPRPLIEGDFANTLDALSPQQQREWLAAREHAKPGWFSRFGMAAKELEPQTEEYFLARAALDIEYVFGASQSEDLGIIRSHYIPEANSAEQPEEQTA